VPKSFSRDDFTRIVGGFSDLHESGAVSFSESRELFTEVEQFRGCVGDSGAFCKGIQQSLFNRLDKYDNLLKSSKESTTSTKTLNSLFGLNIQRGKTITNARLSVVKAPVVKIRDLPKKEDLFTGETFGLKDEQYVAFLPPLSLTDIDLATKKQVTVAGTYVMVVQKEDNYYIRGSDDPIFKLKTGTLKDKENNFEPADPKEISVIARNIGRIEAGRSCSNQYKTSKEVRFWQTGPHAGLPAIFPLDRAPDGSFGWYAATTPYKGNLLSGVQKSGPYAESGEPTHFYIANIGVDGNIDFGNSPAGDDECAQYFSLTETYDGQTALSDSMGVDRTRQFVAQAQQCLKEASQKAKVPKGGEISTRCGVVKVGAPKAATPGLECEDFMDPAKCNFLYNICDPVICPPSRCNLGGRYQTDNVIQTGIIGSLALCAPNFGNPSVPGVGTIELFGSKAPEGGVAVPICLTGVHAGLDNLVQVFKSVRGCLQESLDTGRHVGICDQLQSIYLCEFFWRELTPFIKTGIPALVERTVYNRGGGGEYLTFADAYENSIKQVQFFTSYYGANALRAFQVRSTQEAGSLICKAFIGLRYPNSANLFDELAKPESPPQINAWFDEFPFSSVTVPPTAQYKVFFHIFAGRDEPAYWQVYLKDPPSTPGVNIPEQYIVQTGYAPRGESVDETRDFTAPTGYKQLCVRVNLKEHCGFKKVTTGFAIDELTNFYVKSQTVPDYDIKTEQECTSGKSTYLTASSLPEALIPAIISPGQGGLEESLNPQIYKRGIVRICSQNNPGVGVGPDRWNPVGFCDENRKVRCWLDRNSVKDAISDLGLLNTTLNKAKTEGDKLLEEFQDYKTKAEGDVMLDRIKREGEIKKLLDSIEEIKQSELTSSPKKVEERIDAILTKGSTGKTFRDLNILIEFALHRRHKAEALVHITKIYEKITLHLASPSRKPQKAKTEDKIDSVKVTKGLEKPSPKTEFEFTKDKSTLPLRISPLNDDKREAIRAFNELVKLAEDREDLENKVLVITGFRTKDEKESLSDARATAVYNELGQKIFGKLDWAITPKDGGINTNKVTLEFVDCKIKKNIVSKKKYFVGEGITFVVEAEGNCEGLNTVMNIVSIENEEYLDTKEYTEIEEKKLDAREWGVFDSRGTATIKIIAGKEGTFGAVGRIPLNPGLRALTLKEKDDEFEIAKVRRFSYNLQTGENSQSLTIPTKSIVSTKEGQIIFDLNFEQFEAMDLDLRRKFSELIITK